MENLDKKYNELDKFFQDKLGSNVQIDNSWNVPPIDVLNNALGAINLSKKKRRKRNLLFLLLLLSIGLTFLVIRNSVSLHRIQQKVDIISEEQTGLNSIDKEILIPEKEKKIESQKNKVSKKQQSNSTLTNQTIQTTAKVLPNRNEPKIEVEKISKNEPKTITNKSTSPKQNESRGTSSKQNLTTRTSNKQNLTTTISKQNELKKTIPRKLKATNFKIKATENNGLSYNLPVRPPQKISIPKPTIGLEIMSKQLNLSSISLLPIITNELENLQLLSYQKQVLPADITDKNNVKFWTVYAFSGFNFSKQRMTNPPLNSDFKLLEYDKSYVGLENGVGLQYQFAPKFNFNLTLGYSKLNNESVYSKKIDYDSVNETMHVDGTITYKSDYSIQTTVSSYQNSFEFEVNDDNIKEMDNTTYIEQSCQNYITSLAVEYSLLTKNKFKVKIGLGAGVSYSMKFSQDLNINISTNSSSLYANSPTIISTKEMNRVLLSGLSSASINYQISPKISLGLHNDYYVNLNSIRKINNSSDPKTFNQGFRTFLTAGYRF